MYKEFEGSARGQTGSAHAGSAAAARHSATASPALPQLLGTDEQIAAALGISPRKFHELRAQPWAPKAIALGPRQRRHSFAEWMAAIANMPREKNRSEPAQLARARAAKSAPTVTA